ncbi:MAG: DUF3592 domain-containing protein [Anaerolineales bacterium]|nr:DUF3592 domain-containing protein [Anaerolineales bacterium]
MDEDKIEKMARKQEERINKVLEYSEKMAQKHEERANRIIEQAEIEQAERERHRGPSLLGNLLLLALFNLMVVAMAAGALWFGWPSYTITSNGETTMARVIALSESTDGDGDCCVYSPVFEYTVNGRRHTFESLNSSNPPAYRVGQEVEVIYNINNPSDAAVNSFSELWLVATMLCGAAIVLAVVLNGLAFVRMRSGRPVFDSD